MRLRPLIIGFIVIIAVGLAGWWVSKHITISYEDKRKLPAENIRFNPLSALEHLLLHLDIDVQSDNNRNLLHNLPDTTDTIIIRNLMHPLTHERELALINWIKQGGQLVYEPYWLGKSDSRQYFHEKLGILIQKVEDWENIPPSNHSWANINGEQLYFHMDSQYVLTVNTANLSEDANVESSAIKTSSQIIIQSDEGAHGIKVSHGQGSVLFLSDTDFLATPPVWQSYNDFERYGDNYFTDLSTHDHAYFMWLLLKDRNKVWLVYENTSPAFLSIVYENFPSLVIFSTIWLLIFFLFLLKRFGPIITQQPEKQRNLKQHIQQVGYYHWQQDKANYLLNSWRLRIQHRVLVKHPHLAGLKDHALYEMLAQLSDLTTLEIKQAWSSPCRNQNEFISYTRRLKKLWTL
jgi:hypothetical protein